MSDLIEVLKERPYECNFFQAVALLEEYFGSSGKDQDSVADGKVKFTADPGISFPSSDIHSFNYNSEGCVELYLSFMGLLGISSPLPQYFTAYGAVHSNEPCALTDFLNIFDHRLYTLFFRAWKKYRPIPTWAQTNNFELYKRIGLLSGFVEKSGFAAGRTGSETHSKSSVNSSMMAYAGLLSSVARNAAGLTEILTDSFKGVSVSIEQWASRWAKVTGLKQVGVDFQLGNDSMLGDRIYDRSGKINVILELTDKTMFEKYLPGSENIDRVRDLVVLYSPQPLAFDIEIRFKPSDLIPVVLGKNTAPLGISSSCGDASGSNTGYSITVPGRE